MKRHPKADLSAPQQPGEVIYTPLQLARLINLISRSLRRIVAISAAVMLLVVGGAFSYGFAEDQQDSEDCRARAEGREVLLELVAVAINDIDRDGHRDAAPTAFDPATVLESPLFQDLDPENLAVWTLVLGSLSGQDGPTTSDRLEAFSAELEPISC